MSAVPDIQEELDRKTLDAIQSLLHQESTGRITKAQLNTAIIAVFQCVSGLIDGEIMEMITQISAGVKNVNEVQRAAFVNGDTKRTIALEHVIGSSDVTVRISDWNVNGFTTKRKNFDSARDPVSAAARCFKDFTSGFEDKGYQRI